MSICGSYVQTIVLRHDAGMFTVKGINRLKILQDAIDRNLHPGQAAGKRFPKLGIIYGSAGAT